MPIVVVVVCLAGAVKKFFTFNCRATCANETLLRFLLAADASGADVPRDKWVIVLEEESIATLAF